MTLCPPINFMQWIADNQELLQPPVCNKVIWQDADFICMVVGGPNQRSDFHYDEGPEFFYQLKGDMLLKVHQQGSVQDITIKEGEIFLLPPKIPHSPQRFENTVGLVIERKRLAGEQDGLMWYCENCEKKLYEEYFKLENIETQFGAIFDRFYSNMEHRTCNSCGHINPVPTG